MELSRQSWDEVMNMPVMVLQNYLKWKIDLEEKKQKEIQEATNYGKGFKIPGGKEFKFK